MLVGPARGPCIHTEGSEPGVRDAGPGGAELDCGATEGSPEGDGTGSRLPTRSGPAIAGIESSNGGASVECLERAPEHRRSSSATTASTFVADAKKGRPSTRSVEGASALPVPTTTTGIE